MVSRKQIGILIDNSSGWTGGEYYLKSIIKSIQYIPKEIRPKVFLIYANEISKERFNDLNLTLDYTEFLKVEIRYPKYLLINKVFSILNLPFLIRNKIRLPFVMDFVYPSNLKVEIVDCKKEIFWIPDFQEIHYPNLFSKREILKRRLNGLLLVKNKFEIVFSSNNAFDDFRSLFPNFENNISVLHFRSILEFDKNKVNYENVLKKYSIDYPYFIVSNQFWKHKNHRVLFEALLLAKNRNLNINLVLTGKEEDTRNPSYIIELRKFIEQNRLENYVKSLGFISREDQLALMYKSTAVIQPSLFEGWNTTVEDCKFIGKRMILSNIPIHKEQLEDYGFSFFDPNSANELLLKMQYMLDNSSDIPIQNYEEKIEKFAFEFFNI